MRNFGFGDALAAGCQMRDEPQLLQDTEGEICRDIPSSCKNHNVTPYLKQPITSKEVASNKGFSTIFPLFLWSISASCVFVKRIWLMQWPESYEIHKRFHKLGVALNILLYPLLIHYYSYMIYIWDAWVAGTAMVRPAVHVFAFAAPRLCSMGRGCFGDVV